MKWDMGGSAAVFGAAKALGQIKPPGVEVLLHFPNTCAGVAFMLGVLFANHFPFRRSILLLLPVKT
jgi:leucyl aminopeptidase